MPAGLAAWWPANGEVHEVVRGNHDVEFLPRGAAFGPGEQAQGFVFNGTDHYGRVPAHADLDIGSSAAGLTIELWANPTEARDVPMVQWASPGVEGAGFWQFNGGLGLWGQLVDTAGVPHDINTVNIFTQGTWTHVALTYDRASGIARLYRNGVLVQEENLGVFTPKTNLGMIVGRRLSDPRIFKGTLDEISLYTRPLSITEIQGIYNAGAAGKTPNGNQTPVVSAGPDVDLVNASGVATLAGSVLDDGKPTGEVLTTQWSKVEGPGTVTFASATTATTTATFSAAGTYVLRLDANDGELQAAGDTMTVRIGATTGVAVPAGLAAWWPANGEVHEVVRGNRERIEQGPIRRQVSRRGLS